MTVPLTVVPMTVSSRRAGPGARRAGVLLAAALIGVGCSPTSEASFEPRDVIAAMFMHRDQGDPLAPGGAARAALDRCLQERGFEYTEPDVADVGIEEPPFDWRTGPSVDHAARHGYGLVATQRRRVETPPPQPADVRPVSQEYDAALHGGGRTEGCIDIALRSVDGAGHNGVPEDMVVELATLLARSDELGRIEIAWSDCMRANGVNASSPDDLRSQVGARVAAASPAEYDALEVDERRLATLDAECASALHPELLAEFERLALVAIDTAR